MVRLLCGIGALPDSTRRPAGADLRLRPAACGCQPAGLL